MNSSSCRPPDRVERPLLGGYEVHVWRAFLGGAGPFVPPPAAVLAPDELARARGIAIAAKRDRYLRTRCVLRTLLASYLRESPRVLRFSYGPWGKPALAPGSGRERLRFSISHSGDLAVYAIAWDVDLGIDVERLSAERAHERLAAHFCTPRERDVLRSLEPQERVGAFFACWTRKEALVKATGTGLSMSFDRIEVPVANGAPVAAPTVDGQPSRWTLHDVRVGIGYQAALAVPGHIEGLRLLDFLPGAADTANLPYTVGFSAEDRSDCAMLEAIPRC